MKKIALTVCMVLVLACAFAVSVFALETTYDEITYTLNESQGQNVASIKSHKNVTFTSTDKIIPAYVEYEGVKYYVTTMANEAFYGTNVTSITSAEDCMLTGISSYAFQNCVNLVSVDITAPISSIGQKAFYGCNSLKTLKITNTLETPATVSSDVCDALTGLESVTLHGISIGTCMFRNLTGDSDLKITATNVGRIDQQAFFNAENVTEIYVSGAFTSIASSNTFRDCAKLKKLTIINTGDTVVNSGNGEVNSSLTDLHIEGKITVNSPAFQNNAALKNVYLGDGVQRIEQRAFYKCYALEKVYLADSITYIGDRVFDMEAAGNQTSQSFMFVDENGNMDNTLPTSLTTIDGHFLKRITIANTELIFPQSFTNHNSSQAYDFEGTVYPENFRLIYLGKMTSLNLLTLKKSDITIYLTNNSASDIANERVTVYVNETESGTTITDTNGIYVSANEQGTLTISLDDGLNNDVIPSNYIRFYFCGSNEVCFLTRRNISKGEGLSLTWTNLVTMPVTYEQLTAAGATAEKHPIVGEGVYCEPNCTENGGTKYYCVCGSVAKTENVEEKLGHDFNVENGAVIVSIAYARFDEDGTMNVKCARCEVCDESKASPIFECVGYSAPEDGRDGIAIGYTVNNKAIAEYTEVAGKTLKYGIFAVAKDKLGENDIFTENGTVSDGVITAEISDHGFAAFELKIVGFTDEHKDTKLAIGAYVAVTDEKTNLTEYSYIQYGEPNENENYCFTSYNEIVNSKSSADDGETQ